MGARPTFVVVAIGLLAQGACSEAPLDAIALAPTTLTNGMVVHYTFDEGSGTVAHDSSGNERAGQIQGGTWVQDGRFGGALHLSSGDYVETPSFPDAIPSYTVSAWVRLTDATSPDMFNTLISTEDTGGWEINIDRSQAEPAAQFAFWKGPQTGDYYAVECHCLPFQTWTHVAGVVDEDALTMSLYVGAAETASTPIARTISPGYPTLYIGRWYSSGRFLVGDVDDVVIYDRALVPEEIAELDQMSPPDVP